MGSRRRVLLLWGTMLVSACSPSSREYDLEGVVVAVDASRQEITIKHGDIPRFMPAMTMPFKVKDRALLNGRVPGDVVRATLVVEDQSAYLRALERTGSAPVVETRAAPAPRLEPGTEVPDTTFVDESGATRALSSWRGRALAVTFTYTRCPIPDFCPLMDRRFAEVQRAVLADDGLRGRVRLLSVSIDPAHDRPAVLARHARRVGADPSVWTLATGRGSDIEAFAGRFGLSILRESASPDAVVHNLRTAVLDARGVLSAVLRGNEWTPDHLAAELRRALDAR